MGRAEHLTAVGDDALARVAEHVRPTVLAREQRFPVVAALSGLLPGGGLRRGSTLSVGGPAATSLALASVVGASRDGAWVAAVGFPSLGLVAAAELGVVLERLVLVADRADDGSTGHWASVVAALVDAFDIVLVASSGRVSAGDARRLVARTRERGALLVQVSTDDRPRWPEVADVSLRVVEAAWEGLGEGYGHLQARRVTVESGGRREAARPRRATLWLPAADGGVEEVLPEPVELRPRRGG